MQKAQARAPVTQIANDTGGAGPIEKRTGTMTGTQGGATTGTFDLHPTRGRLGDPETA